MEDSAKGRYRKRTSFSATVSGVPTRRSRDLVTAAGLLIEAANYLQRGIHADVERATRLPGPWLEVLLRLHRSPGRGMRINEIASQVTLPASSFSRLADRMEEAGLVARSPDPVHRRATLLRMTPAGEQRFADILKVFEPSMRARFGRLLSDQELDALEATTRRLRDANRPGVGVGGPTENRPGEADAVPDETHARRSAASARRT